MRRILTVAASTAAAVGLVIPAAQAATNPSVSYKGLPSDWHALSVPCAPGSPTAYTPAHVTGPVGAPAGVGSLRLAGSSSTSPIVFFGPTDSPLLSSLTAFDGYVNTPSTAGATPEFDIEASDGSVDYSLHIAASGAGWVHVDTTGATVLSWDSFDNQTSTEASGSSTLSDFVTAHPNATFNAFVLAPETCGPETYYLDDVHYAVGSVDNTVDFEAPLPAALTNGSHPSSVLSGSVVTLSAHLSSSGTPLAGQTVKLYSHGVGTSYRLVKSLTTDSSGAVSMRVGLNSTTTYQWRYPATSTNYAPATASAFTIASRQRVAVSSKPTTTTYRGFAVIKGRVTPNKAGVTVRLIRLVSGKRIVVASARTTTGGYYTIKAPMYVRGTYSYLVSALPYTGENLGQSTTFKITTR